MENINTFSIEQPWTIESEKESVKVGEAFSKLLDGIKSVSEKIKNDPEGAALYSGLLGIGSAVTMSLAQPEGWKLALGQLAVAVGMLSSLSAIAYKTINNK